MSFKVVIAGGRDFKDKTLLFKKCDKILNKLHPEDVIILSGMAKGADTLAVQYADERGYKLEKYPVTKKDWELHGKKAGILRNKTMGENADAVIAFWDGKSRGTQHMIFYAQTNLLALRVIRY